MGITELAKRNQEELQNALPFSEFALRLFEDARQVRRFLFPPVDFRGETGLVLQTWYVDKEGAKTAEFTRYAPFFLFADKLPAAPFAVTLHTDMSQDVMNQWWCSFNISGGCVGLGDKVLEAMSAGRIATTPLLLWDEVLPGLRDKLEADSPWFERFNGDTFIQMLDFVESPVYKSLVYSLSQGDFKRLPDCDRDMAESIKEYYDKVTRYLGIASANQGLELHSRPAEEPGLGGGC